MNKIEDRVERTGALGSMSRHYERIQDAPPLFPRRREVLKSMANRLLHSKSYQLWYIALACISLFCMIVTLIWAHPPLLVFVLEYILCLALFFEVLLNWAVQAGQYWKSKSNLFDVGMLFLCVLLIIIFHSHPHRTLNDSSSSDEWQSFLDAFVLFVRNGIQLVRLVFLLKKHRSSTLTRESIVDLESGNPLAGESVDNE
jgi:hypothetical protein